jgi:plasmid stabilization system protein ParE
MNVVITDPAADDLEVIGNWIAKDNPARALTFIRELRVACDALADAPNLTNLSRAMSTPVCAVAYMGII